ncbi:MAG: EAL domain-containing protein, partial [Eubacterium sp.]
NRLKSMMTYALENDGFEVYYQPIYSIPLMRYATSEALVRMRDPEFGMISPAEFIPMAEENGMIIDIGLTVFEKVCRFVAETPYEKAGFDTVGINLSVVQCMQENLADDLIAIMEKYHIDPHCIKLEITETIAAASVGTLQDTMTHLINYGCSFALDDFGIGYASMSNMLTLPLKIIKLDKSLIERMVEDDNMKMAVDCIIGLIHRLNMRVVAEGVEVLEELEILKSLDCDFIQGFYFSKPLPEDSFNDLVREAAEKSHVQNHDV